MDTANADSADSPGKPNSLTQRIVSALVLVPLLLVVIIWSRWSLAALVMLVVALALRELYSAFAHGGYQARRPIGMSVAVGLVIATTLQPLVAFDLHAPLITLAIIISLIYELPRHNRPAALIEWALTIAGALYLGGLLRYIVLLRDIETPLAGGLAAAWLAPGAAWLITVMLLTWGQDAFAYFAGRRFGRHHMTPGLSPKKTWEGAIGGLLGAILLGVIAVVALGLPITPLAGALLGLIAGVVGPLGDLAESLIKRQVGLKDAGSLIPGHGGILDRIDSLLFAAPVLFYVILMTQG
ncbi:MAG TPA: phosphatidate cytidylyltransferase [Roseiflexaceae bacterium]|nr:phosphatidate cytidylyltransferase [Roseiflexaceae bacterium]HMP39771.1 phosphatidate cytidylyltransferase [Roseiflexaceae bacterium]